MISNIARRETSRERFRQRVTDAASSRHMARATREIADGARRLTEMANAPERQHVAMLEFAQLQESRWRNGQFSVIDHFDFDQFMADRFGNQYNDIRAGLAARDEQYRSSRIQEHLSDVIASDQFTNILTTQIRRGMIERCEHAPQVMMSLVNTNVRLAPFPIKVERPRNPGDVVDDCSGELEPTNFYGIPKIPLITLPKACKKKFALGYTREMLSGDLNGSSRDVIDRHAESLSLHAEKLLVDLVWGLYDTTTPSANPFPFIEDDVQYNTYQAVGAGGPWENAITKAGLNGTFQPFEIVSRLLELRRDPYSGEPIDCGENPTIVVTGEAGRQLAADGLGRFMIERTGVTSNVSDTVLGALGSDSIRGTNNLTYDRTGFPISSSAIATSRYIWDRLVAWLQTTAGGGLSASNAKVKAANAFIFGDLKRAFAWGTEWEREKLERSGRDTWEYFSQEVIYSVKWMEKTTPVALDPMLSIRCMD